MEQPEQTSGSATDTFVAGYLAIGHRLGRVAGIITFLGAYVWSVFAYGFLLGFGLGWLPSLLLALLVGALTIFLWGPAILMHWSAY